MRQSAALGLVLALGACGDSPTPSLPAASTNLPGTGVVSGQVLETVSRRPVAGALLEFSGGTVRTDSTGGFQLPANGGVLSLTIASSGHVTRRSFVAAGTSGAVLDVIETGSLWDLAFYRELARNGAGGGRLQALNPWTVEPRFYVDRRPESGSGREIPDRSVATVVAAIGEVLPLLTSGRLMGGFVETGTSPPEDRTEGTVVIRWDPVEIAESAGAASGITRGVGGNSSVVVLRSIEETGVIYHELGHVLGLYHPLGGRRPSLMAGSGTAAPPFFTEWDVFHAKVLYARPPGNTDIDNDPAGFLVGALSLRAGPASEVVAICILP